MLEKRDLEGFLLRKTAKSIDSIYACKAVTKANIKPIRIVMAELT